MKKPSKNIIFCSLLIITAILSVLFKNIFLDPIIFVFLIYVPGKLFMTILRKKFLNFTEDVLFAITGSLVILLLTGLFMNIILPLLGVLDPLSQTNVHIGILLISIILLVYAYLREENIPSIKAKKWTILEQVIVLFAFTLPLMSILGAEFLNVWNNNLLTIIMVLCAIVLAIFVIIFHKSLNMESITITILMISLALLFMYSMRSNHLVGVDIHDEYKYFQETKQAGYWDIASDRNPYNSCLSITILPTILSQFLQMPDEYIFKILFQIIFALTPVVIFLIANRYLSKAYAFGASLFFVSQYQFILVMQQVNRQEIAMFMFAMLILIILSDDYSKLFRNVLISVILIGITLSHYSTSYITVATLFGLWALYFVYVLLTKYGPEISKKWFNRKIHKERKIYLWIPIMLLALIIVWNGLYTQSTKNVEYVYDRTIENVKYLFTGEMLSESAKDAVWRTQRSYSVIDIQNYSMQKQQEYKEKFPNGLYDSGSTEDSTLKPKYSVSLPTKNYKSWNVVSTIHQSTMTIIKILIFLGVLLLLIQIPKAHFDIELILLVIMASFLVALMLVVPFISTAYNFERIYQQMLIIVGIPLMFCIFTIEEFIRKIFKLKNLWHILLIVLLTLNYLITTQIVYQFVGGSAPLQFNNIGKDYDRFYVLETEFKTAQFLGKYGDNSKIVYADAFAKDKIGSFSGKRLNIEIDVLPSTIIKNSYVFSSVTNTEKQMALARHRQKEVAYSYPTKFLNINKNKIYSTQNTGIYSG